MPFTKFVVEHWMICFIIDSCFRFPVSTCYQSCSQHGPFFDWHTFFFSSRYCCKPDLVLKRGTYGSHYAYPILLDHLHLDVSQNRNWNIFLDELALELGLQVSRIERINFYVLSLSRLNISMTMVPQGISFSANEASAINSSLVILFVAIITMLVRCLRTFRPGKTKTSPVEIGVYLKFSIIHLTLSLWCTSL